jgi:hypothetical protein
VSGRQQDRFEALRAAVLASPRWQAELGGAADWPTFIARGVEAAASLGVAITAEDLAQRRRDDPLGLLRFEPPPCDAPAAPQPGWLPAQVVWDGRGPAVDWAYFGQRRLKEPLYEGSLRRALATPFNVLFRFRTPIGELGRWSRALPGLRPSGLIFHMSRCGSTLVSQMLAASAANIVVAEAAPIDGVVQLGQPGLLAEMIGAFGQIRAGETRYFIKLEAWHALALPLFRQALPATPWLFLYRDPVEVMVSQRRQSTAAVAPAPMLSAILGEDLPYPPDLAQCAQVLGAVCERALAGFGEGGGLAVNYAQLPGALWTRILPHFGVSPSPDERAEMERAARLDAKAPWLEFAADDMAKHQEADDGVRAICAAHLDGPYRRLVGGEGFEPPTSWV